MRNNYLKGFILSLAFLALTTQLHAQELHFMPKVGFSLSTIMGLDGSARSGANVGLSGEYLFPNERYALEGGVYYSMQGIQQKQRYLDEYLTGTIKNDYINIPIYAKYYLLKGLNVFAGPQFGFNVRNKFTLDGGQKKHYSSMNLDKVFHLFDFALCIGGGYQFENGLFFTVNYNFGLTDVLKEKDIQLEGESATIEIQTDDKTVRNGVFQANIGWRF
ncbi:porin family protein [Parabacteroides sp.]